MKITMVIPTYWTRESKVGWREGDDVYDHPAPLDQEGTILRAIQSTAILKDQDFQLVILAVATSRDIADQTEAKVKSIINTASHTTGVKLSLFGHSHLTQLHNLFEKEGKKEYLDFLQLRGYSNVRNMCMFIPHMLGSEAAVLIDDDEVFEDPDFIRKTKEFIGKNVNGRMVNAVAGYYLQPDGHYRLNKTFRPWMKYWDQYEKMNDAFDKFIGTEPRLKETPFVFGGNMIIHRNLFTRVPFDPNVVRGEDIDFLINARMFGFTFFLDNQLSIKHLPPPKTHPTWMRLREDIYRFIYQREKIKNQEKREEMTRVMPEDLDPYPGCFLKSDLEKKIEQACRVLSEEYMAEGNIKDGEEAMNNIELSRTDAVPKYNPFQSLCGIQRKWQELMEYSNLQEVRSSIGKVID